MFVDARDLADHSRLQADLCVVGSGAAAIPLALEFIDTPLRVVLLESGGQAPNSRGRGIYQIVAGSPPRLSIDPSRTWSLGGNTNYWNGNCRPFDAADFEPRAWIPHSGWPIRKPQLLPYYERAQAICGLSDFRWYDLDACRPHLRHQPLDVDSATLTSKILHTCPVQNLADLHRARLEAAENVCICTHTHAVRLRTNAAANEVGAVEAVGPAGRRLRIEAGTFVLAAGGIENARLLLCSNDVQRNGLANAHDLVGRFFMEHWYVDIPLGRWGDAHDLAFHGGRESAQSVGGANLWGQLVLSEAFMRHERVAGLSLHFQRMWPANVDSTTDGVTPLRQRLRPKQPFTDLRLALADPNAATRRVLSKLNPRRWPREGCVLKVQLEQTPDRDNRIRLSAKRDEFGQPTAELNLHLSAEDRHGHARSLQRGGNRARPERQAAGAANAPAARRRAVRVLLASHGDHAHAQRPRAGRGGR
jgi:choline dehydrogenase-like flavoprotein